MASRKLTPEMLEEATELLLTGVPMDATAMIFGVSESTMRKTIRHFQMYGRSLWAQYPTLVEEQATEE
jgi:transposase-like protein